MASPVLAVAEHWGGEVDTITYQVIAKGRQVADAMGSKLAVAVFGECAEAACAALRDKGADTILQLEHPLLAKASPSVRAEAVIKAARQLNARLVLVGFSLVGMELTPAIAARLGVAPLTNCVDVALLDGKLFVTRPVFDGTMHARLVLEGDDVAVIGLQKGATPSKPLSAPEVGVERMMVEIAAPAQDSELIEVVADPVGAFDITKADIVVSAGRGIGAPEKLGLIEDLAASLGGLMGCSRPLVDQGWLPKERQVGASGRTVQPKVYVACGISGASQHLAGMSESRMIVAINKDPNAPIFQVAHYGVVGDLFEIVPTLTAAAKAAKG
jgi:electron transfer flavoprotein alpha subunit